MYMKYETDSVADAWSFEAINILNVLSSKSQTKIDSQTFPISKRVDVSAVSPFRYAFWELVIAFPLTLIWDLCLS